MNEVHLCIERNCPRSLAVCLRWIDGDMSFIEQVDRYGNTILHTGKIFVYSKCTLIKYFQRLRRTQLKSVRFYLTQSGVQI